MCGCSSESNGSVAPRELQQDVTMADGTTADVVSEGGLAVSLNLADGSNVELTGNETKLGDQLVIRTADGQVEVHRKPTVLMNEIDRLPHLYLQEDTLEELITDGFRGEPYVGPNNALYWSARTCTHADCESQSMGTAERPYLLIRKLPGVWVKPDGTLASVDAMPNFSVPCPICKRPDGVRAYTLPDTASRRSELTTELERSRAARDRTSR